MKHLHRSLQWSEFMNLGNDVPHEYLIERLRGQAPNKCCTLIYTVRKLGLLRYGQFFLKRTEKISIVLMSKFCNVVLFSVRNDRPAEGSDDQP